MDNIYDNIFFYYCVGALFALLFIAINSRGLNSILDPLLFNLGLTGFPFSFIATIVFDFHVDYFIWFFVSLSYIVGLSIGFRKRHGVHNIVANSNSFRRDQINPFYVLPEQVEDRIVFLISGVFCLLVYFINIIINIGVQNLFIQASYRGDILVNRYAYFLSSGVTGPLIFFLSRANSKVADLFFYIFLVLYLGASIAGGSKSGIFSILPILACYCWFRFIYNKPPVNRFKNILGNRYKVVVVSVFLALLLLKSYVAINFMGSDFAVIAIHRVLAQFDIIYYAVGSQLPVGGSSLDFLKFWFAPLLKFFGLFNSPFNGVNETVAYHSNLSKLGDGAFLPNNLASVDLTISLGYYWGAALTFLFGLLIGYLHSYLRVLALYSYSGKVFLSFITFYAGSIFFDTQSTFSFLIGLLVCFPVLLFINAVLGRFSSR